MTTKRRGRADVRALESVSTVLRLQVSVNERVADTGQKTKGKKRGKEYLDSLRRAAEPAELVASDPFRFIWKGKPGQENAAEKFVSGCVDRGDFPVEGVETGPAASLSNTRVPFSFAAVGGTATGSSKENNKGWERERRTPLRETFGPKNILGLLFERAARNSGNDGAIGRGRREERTTEKKGGEEKGEGVRMQGWKTGERSGE